MGYKTQLQAMGGGFSMLTALYLMSKTAIYNGKSLFFDATLSFLVDTGHKAIIFNKITGLKEGTYREGWHLKMPWLERAIIYNVKA
jgi:prohibitin 2